MKKMMLGTVVVLMLVAVGCGKKEQDLPKIPVQVPKQFVSEMPDGTPMPIPEARSLAAGADVVLQGRVMGVNHPFVEGRAAVVLGDPETLTICKPERCSTPWDACCDAPEVKGNGTVMLQILGDDGKVLAHGLKGVGGLKELSKVTVVGKVAPQSTKEAFIVNVKALYVEPGEPAA